MEVAKEWKHLPDRQELIHHTADRLLYAFAQIVQNREGERDYNSLVIIYNVIDKLGQLS